MRAIYFKNKFVPELPASEVAFSVDRLEANIRKEYPMIKNIFIEAEAFREKKEEGGSPAGSCER